MFKVIGRILATVLVVTAALTIVGCRTRSYEVEVSYENGTVEGYGTYEVGETVTLTAEAAEGYAFDGWSGDFTEEDATLEFEMPDNDVSLTAHFVPAEYNVTVEYDSDKGTVEGYGAKAYGTSVELTATPSEGYEFIGWEGDRTGEETTLTFDMPAEDIAVEALFEAKTYTVHVDYDEDKGTVEGHGEIAYGETVVLTATPDEGYTFAEWTGDFTGENETLEFTMPAEDVTIEAAFAPAIYTVSVTYDDSEGIVEGYGDIAYGETVVLTAIPETGYVFEEWTGDFTGDSETLEFTMPAEDVVIEAHFAQAVFTITVEYDEDKGSVEGPTEATYGQQVTLFAEPAEHHTFEGWTGDREGRFHSITFFMPAEDVTLEANFEAKSFEVEVVYDDDRGTVEGYGEIKYNETVTLTAASKEGYLFGGWTGFLESDDKTITFDMPAENIVLEAHFVVAYTITLDYDSDEGSVSGYDGKFAAGETVELTASPGTGYAFDGWTGYLESDEATITFEMPAEDVELSVAFALVDYELTITTEGNGQVSGEGTYNYGDTVTIEATAASGWRFIQWSGDLSSSSAEFTFTMPAADIEIEALFKEIHTVTITYDDAKGSISPDEPLEYVEGERVTLEAVAKSGYKFYEWEGYVESDRATITFTMPDEDVSLTATFVVADFTVTVDYDDDQGSVTGAGEYSYGADATLTATPKTGYEFIGWSGDKDSDQTTITLEYITEDIHLVATFAPLSYDVNITHDDSMGSVFGEGTYEFGEEVIVEAIPATGYEFVEWTGDLTSTDRMFIFDMPAQDVTLQAVFAEMTADTIADIRAMDDGDSAIAEGVITKITDHRTFFIEDETGAISVFDGGENFTDGLSIGDKVRVVGKRTEFNGLKQIGQLDIVEVLAPDQMLPEAIDIGADRLDDEAFMLEHQGHLVNLEDFLITYIEEDQNGNIDVTIKNFETGNTIDIRYDYRLGADGAAAHLLTFEEGDAVDITAMVLGWFNSPQLLYTAEDEIEETVLSEDSLEAYLEDFLAQPEQTRENLDLPTSHDVGGWSLSIDWDSDKPGVIATDGTVNPPPAGDPDEDVKLTATVSDDNDFEHVITFDVTVLAEMEDLMTIFETGFESEEGFTARTNYMGTHENEGIDPYTWTFFYGTPSTTGNISGEQSAQMRWYSSQPDNLGYVQTNFAIPDVRLVSFSALGTGGNDIEVSYSYDGETWQEAVIFELDTSAQDFVYEINPDDPVYLRFKLVSDGDSGSRVTLDDIIIESAETPAAEDWYNDWHESMVEAIAEHRIAPPKTVTDDIILSTEEVIFSETYTISWESDNTDVIANDGTVHRPAHGDGDATVTLIATVTNSHTFDLSFTVTVQEEEGIEWDYAEHWEPFEGSGTTYVEETFIGDSGFEWYVTDVRKSLGGYEIDGGGIMVRVPGYLETHLPDGIGHLRLDILMGFTGGSPEDRTIEIYVNDVKVGEHTLSDTDVETLFIENIDQEGPLTLRIQAAGVSGRQIVLNNLEWTTCGDSATDEEFMEHYLAPPSETTDNIILPDYVPGYPDYSVTWTSGDTDVIEEDGTVHRPALGEDDAHVELTATVENSESYTFTYTVTVLAPEVLSVAEARDSQVGEEIVVEGVVHSIKHTDSDLGFDGYFIQDADGTSIFVYKNPDGIEVGNKIIIQGELNQGHGSVHHAMLWLPHTSEVIENDGLSHDITVIDDQDLETIAGNWPDNEAMRFKVSEMTIVELTQYDQYIIQIDGAINFKICAESYDIPDFNGDPLTLYNVEFTLFYETFGAVYIDAVEADGVNAID